MTGFSTLAQWKKNPLKAENKSSWILLLCLLLNNCLMCRSVRFWEGLKRAFKGAKHWDGWEPEGRRMGVLGLEPPPPQLQVTKGQTQTLPFQLAPNPSCLAVCFLRTASARQATNLHQGKLDLHKLNVCMVQAPNSKFFGLIFKVTFFFKLSRGPFLSTLRLCFPWVGFLCREDLPPMAPSSSRLTFYQFSNPTEKRMPLSPWFQPKK